MGRSLEAPVVSADSSRRDRAFDIEVHLRKTPRLEERPQPRHRPV